MNSKTAVAMALVLVAGVGPFLAAPAAAVAADCTEDYTIPETQPLFPRTLAAGASEVGLIDVSAAGGDKTVRVQLDSDDDMLEFGIFEVVSNQCQRSTNVNTVVCQSDVLLDTTPLLVFPPVSQDCELDAPSSGARSFYFVFENVEPGGDALQYSVWTP